MEKIITGILIIAFFGWLIMDNCCSEGKSCAAEVEETTEGTDEAGDGEEGDGEEGDGEEGDGEEGDGEEE